MTTYTINTNGKKVHLYFGHWSISRFCELNGNLSFSAFQDLLANELSFKHITSLILCGAEHYALKNKQPFTYNALDASDWIDEIGGITSEKGMELLNAIGRAVVPKYQGIEVSGNDEKKKATSPGMTSELNASTQELKTAG